MPLGAAVPLPRCTGHVLFEIQIPRLSPCTVLGRLRRARLQICHDWCCLKRSPARFASRCWQCSGVGPAAWICVPMTMFSGRSCRLLAIHEKILCHSSVAAISPDYFPKICISCDPIRDDVKVVIPSPSRFLGMLAVVGLSAGSRAVFYDPGQPLSRVEISILKQCYSDQKPQLGFQIVMTVPDEDCCYDKVSAQFRDRASRGVLCPIAQSAS